MLLLLLLLLALTFQPLLVQQALLFLLTLTFPLQALLLKFPPLLLDTALDLLFLLFTGGSDGGVPRA